ncbi:MAG: ribosome biogenesis GTPase YlqF [Clostridiaceae bacterium]|nr:ribosome biogenesis GTPase YlqF [Clostridiaceae bacterium]
MSSEINWFPGHMRKALSEITDRLKWVDIVIETCDARIPFSSRNPELHKLINEKNRIIVLNKADLADPHITGAWISQYEAQGIKAMAVDANNKGDIQRLKKKMEHICQPILDKAAARGRIGRPVRAMVVGIPNTGKSTIINALCNRKVVITGNRPGVTRSFQWAKSSDSMELMDMPGVLWPNLGSKHNKLVLALSGAIKTEVTDMIFVASEGMKYISTLYPDYITTRYQVPDVIDAEDINEAYERYLSAAKKKGCILSGGRIDEERFASLFIDDFRTGRIGRITLEVPK